MKDYRILEFERTLRESTKREQEQSAKAKRNILLMASIITVSLFVYVAYEVYLIAKPI
jgi:hypothetical protein